MILPNLRLLPKPLHPDFYGLWPKSIEKNSGLDQVLLVILFPNMLLNWIIVVGRIKHLLHTIRSCLRVNGKKLTNVITQLLSTFSCYLKMIYLSKTVTIIGIRRTGFWGGQAIFLDCGETLSKLNILQSVLWIRILVTNFYKCGIFELGNQTSG